MNYMEYLNLDLGYEDDLLKILDLNCTEACRVLHIDKPMQCEKHAKSCSECMAELLLTELPMAKKRIALYDDVASISMDEFEDYCHKHGYNFKDISIKIFLEWLDEEVE